MKTHFFSPPSVAPQKREPLNFKSLNFKLLTIFMLLLSVCLLDLHAGGKVKAKRRSGRYFAKAIVNCRQANMGRSVDRDRERHPRTAQAFVRIPTNTFLWLRGSMDVWIGPGGWGMNPDVRDNRCFTGLEGSDFGSLFQAYELAALDSFEYGLVRGGEIKFDAEAKSVTIPDISGAIFLDTYPRSFSFYLTVWETPEEDYEEEEDWHMPDKNILWQGSAVYVDGELILDGFSSEEIAMEDGTLSFNEFTKSFIFPEADFDSIEVDIRYETEESSEALLKKTAEETNIKLGDRFRIFPNPVFSNAVVSFSFSLEESQEDLLLQLFDQSGRLVADLGKLEYAPGRSIAQKKINVAHLAPGIYYLSASGPTQLYVKRLIKH